MPDYPPAVLARTEQALIEAAADFGHGDLIAGSAATLARAALDAAAPLLAESCAEAILKHMEAHGPKGNTPARRAWRRQFGIAARVAAGAFTTEAEMKRQAAEALARGDFAVCHLDEAGRPVPAPEGES